MGRAKKMSDREILSVIVSRPDPVVTASELTDHTEYKIDGIRERLEELEDGGYVRSRDVGARSKIWWITTAGRDLIR